MDRRTRIINLLFVLALLALAACAPQASSPNPVTAAPATQGPTTPAPVEPETTEPQMTNAPTEESATPSPSAGTATCTDTEPVGLTAAGGTISYKDVQFKLDPDLGFNFTVQECEAGAEDGSMGPQVYPAHLVFKADSPLPDNFLQPEIRVYPVSGDLQAYTYPLNSLAELQQVLDERPEPSPWYAGAALHAGEKYLDSHYNTGVRGIVEYIQDLFFWTNDDLQYTYNG